MSFIGEFFKKKGTADTTQKPLLAPEQEEAFKKLLIGADSSFKGPLGSFDPSQIEELSQNKLFELISGGLPGALTEGTEFLSGVLDQEFDPTKGIFPGFKTGVLRGAGEASDVLNRELAIQGGRFGTQGIKEKGLLAERTTDILTNKLAELFDTAQQRKLQAAGGLIDAGTISEQIQQQRLGLGFGAGSLDRLLKNAAAQAKIVEFEKDREFQLRSLTTILGGPSGLTETRKTKESGFKVKGETDVASDLAALFALSSKTLKTGIKGIKNPLDTVKKMEGVEFNWNDTGIKDGGVIAEQIESINKDMTHDINGIKHVKPMMIIGYLIEAVKELSQEVKSLRSA